MLNSVSRVASQVCDSEHLHYAGELRRVLAKIDELQLFVDLEEYQTGENEENDCAMNKRDRLFAWLKQRVDEHADFNTITDEMKRHAS